ncbi:MAG TPA: hypothetical protein VJ998_10060 [Pseudomonadales bacterium]|nr:hypothetical protein [Pseudomonadales bacterium]
MIRLLNTGRFAAPSERRRLWLELGTPIIIGPHQILQLLEHKLDGYRDLVMRIEVPGRVVESPVPAGFYYDASAWSQMLIIPRAIEVSPQGGVSRVFIEFVRTAKSVSWAV